MVAGPAPPYIGGVNDLVPPFDHHDPSPPSGDHEPPPVDRPPGASNLRRTRDSKIFGGVAGGVARRFDVDVSIVRVAFVVLALLYGLGAAIYLAMWVLVPRDPADESSPPAREEVSGARRIRWLRVALPAAVAVLVVAVVAARHDALRFASGVSVLWLIFLIVLAVVSLTSPARRLTFRRLLALAFLGFISLVILALGSLFGTLQFTGVPLSGGSGYTVWRPRTVAEVRHNYRGAIGETIVDLSGVAFGPSPFTLRASQGIGELIVDLPANTRVNLRTHVGVGGVVNTYYLVSHSSAGSAAANGTLTLELSVGVGSLEVARPVTVTAATP